MENNNRNAGKSVCGGGSGSGSTTVQFVDTRIKIVDRPELDKDVESEFVSHSGSGSYQGVQSLREGGV